MTETDPEAPDRLASPIPSPDRATIAFLGWDFSTPLIAVILGALIAGVIFDELFGLVYRARRRKTLSDRAQLNRFKRSVSSTE